jgi:arylsulfatase A-like enzyme
MLALGLLGGCGSESTPTRLAVIDRGLSWRLVDDAAPAAPLSLSWGFEDDAAHGWQLPGGRPASARAGALVASGEGRVVLLSPPDAAIDGELQHWLTWRVRTSQVEHMLIAWRGSGQAFSPSRSTSKLPIDSAAGWQVASLPLSTLRGLRDAADAVEGIEQLKLSFVGPPGSTVSVELDTFSCVSDYDQADGKSLAVQRLGRDGVYRSGVVLRPGRTAALSLDGRPGDRLRLSLAVAGTDELLDVTLHDEAGLLPDLAWSLQPGRAWHDVALDLPAETSGPLRLRLRLAPGAAPGAALLVGGPLHLSLRPDEHPNVLLYVEDTLRRDRLSTYGHERSTDPHLRRVAADGVVFEHTLAASNWTRPSISSLLTSLNPLTHGNRTHLDRVADDVTTLAEAFADAGYLTASFVTNYHGGAWSGLDQGFDSSREPTADGASQLRSTLTSAAIADSLAEFLRQHADERIFVHVHTLDPHEPYQPGQADLAALGLTGAPESLSPELLYEAEVHHNDRQLAALDATLQELQLVDNTLLVFTSDHGEAFGEHDARGHRRSLHGEELDVPWVMRWPRGLPAGHRTRSAAAHVDLAPTLLGLAGLDIPASWQGRDLSSAARGNAAEANAAGTAPRRRLAGCVYGDDQPGRPAELAALQRDGRGGEYKLVATLADDGSVTPRSLYRLDQDPGEQLDLLASLPPGGDAPDPGAAEIARSLTAWLTAAVARDLAAGTQATADPMDPATREWMMAMGYLGR